MKQILITGGAGFIGSHLCARLLEEGNEVTQQTSESLNKVITELDAIITEVANIRIASDRQAVSVKEIEDGVKQIDDVIQTNSATSEQCASASEELANQSQALRDTISRYKLKENTYRNPMYADSYNRRNSYMPQAGNNEQIISLDGEFGKYYSELRMNNV